MRHTSLRNLFVSTPADAGVQEDRRMPGALPACQLDPGLRRGGAGFWATWESSPRNSCKGRNEGERFACRSALTHTGHGEPFRNHINSRPYRLPHPIVRALEGQDRWAFVI